MHQAFPSVIITVLTLCMFKKDSKSQYMQKWLEQCWAYSGCSGRARC